MDSRTTETATQRILVVDDDPTISDVVARYLRGDGFDVAVALDGQAALDQANETYPDLVVLDLMLPKVDGLEVCRRLRALGNVPIIMLTAKGEEMDRLIGLNLGADDYMTKPFSPRELVARVKAVLRRTAAMPEPYEGDTLRFDELSINPLTRQVVAAGKDVELTAKEFDVLLYLAQHPKQVFSREQLLNDVWDYLYAGDTSTVTVHIRRLREKIERDPARPRFIQTVWGVGYKFL
ncbi:MAG: response regulator transcription factor [Chloroflexi bacterium]|nr:response regulator transcription factor [Chloroflexota bacterium]MCH9038582.1 response regulator transcription factor [Chloroflexota bacterium]MCI0795946.1 response regulator transcription factor [Chloroflexota bacterium]MCI0870172.1 response regulator transcription factor [Chloroflexota bacterium]MCI0887599.1 response regulator transcription factor [Chloroflexota bacterium]